MQGEGLDLPRLNVPGFVDFPWKALPFGRSGRGMAWEVGEQGQEEGSEGELWLEWKIKFKNKNIKK